MITMIQQSFTVNSLAFNHSESYKKKPKNVVCMSKSKRLVT